VVEKPAADLAAKAIVQRVLKGHNGKWLFQSDESKSGHIEDPRAQPGEFTPWKDAAGKKVAFTLHGLRASYISAAHAAGVSDRHAKLIANHAVHKSDVHGGYILTRRRQVRGVEVTFLRRQTRYEKHSSASRITSASTASRSERRKGPPRGCGMGTEAVPISIRQLLSTQRRQVCRRRSGCL
jgi:hypothetical protein